MDTAQQYKTQRQAIQDKHSAVLIWLLIINAAAWGWALRVLIA